MKKLLFFAALVLGLASCQKDVDTVDVNMGAEETVVTIALPEATRATSGQSGWANTENPLRVIFQVYDENGKTTDDMRQTGTIAYGETTANFNVRLVPNHTYTFVAWADQGEEYFNVEDLKNVTFAEGAWTAMNENIDAYTATQTIEAAQSIPNVNLTLTRPFAKVRVVTTDIEAIRDLGWEPTTAVATYQENVPTSFDAVAGTVGEATVENPARSFTYADVQQYEDNEGEMTLFADYIFVPTSGTAKFGLRVNDVDKEIRTTSFNTDIPAVRNYLTTIKGSILTGDNNITVEVTVNEEFEAEKTYIEGDLTLTEDMIINRPLYVRAGASAVIDLNGYNIINTTNSEVYGEGEGIVVYGDLTINGEGTVQGTSMAVWARGSEGTAKVTINGGTYKGCEEGLAKGGRSVIYASGNNTIDIYDGTFEALAADKTSYANKDGVYAALNIQDKKGFINVYGGKFKNFDPATPGTEPKAWNDEHPNGFVAEGYGSVEKGDYWYVVPELISDLFYVTEDTTVTLTEDLNVAANSTIQTYNATGDITIDGNGKSVVSAAESVNDFQWLNGSLPAMSTILSSENGELVTVNDLSFEGTMSAIMLGHYVDSNSNWYNTVLNNVNVINTKVVSFSQNIAPAVCIYGTATLNNCNIYGTTLSELDTDPAWPVYDVAAINYSNTTVNGGKIGTFFVWNQAGLVIDEGAEVDTIVVRGNMNTTKYGVKVKAGTTVDTIDLSAITNNKKVNITIEDGATVNHIVANGVEYASIDHFMGNVTAVNNASELSAALADANVKNILLNAGEYGVIVAQSNKTIVGTPEAKVDAVNLNGAENLTLKNINFDVAKAVQGYNGAGDAQYLATIISRGADNKTVTGAKNLVIDGCTFTGTFPNGGGCVTHFCDQHFTGTHNVTIKNCTFDVEMCGYAIYGYYFGSDPGHFIIEGNTFKSATLANTIYMGRYSSSTPVELKNNKFETHSTLSNVVIFVQDHGYPGSDYGATYTAEGNTFAE